MSDSTTQALQRIEAGQQRMEAKIDALIEALADEVPEPLETHTLEGEVLPGERDASQSLDTTED